jgi:hypothetical protein
MDEELIEKVARAIYDIEPVVALLPGSAGYAIPWEQIPGDQEPYRVIARAALASIPTVDMREAAAKVELARLRELVKRTDDFIHSIVADLGDEGDRVYLGSTNQADELREFSRELQHETYLIMEAEGD